LTDFNYFNFKIQKLKKEELLEITFKKYANKKISVSENVKHVVSYEKNDYTTTLLIPE